MASVTLDDTGKVILPHEGTVVAPVVDRLRLLEATRANLTPIYGLYAGGGRAAAAIEHVTEAAPAVDAIDEAGLGHRLWPISDPATIARWGGRGPGLRGRGLALRGSGSPGLRGGLRA